MSDQKRVLIAGESWFVYETHVKGFDTFYTSKYEEGVGYLRDALEEKGFDVTYMPNHLVPEHFPFTLEELQAYDCVILSDIGSNTFLLPMPVFEKGEKRPNRLALIRDYVNAGGGFLMMGGYMAFSGIDAKARYGMTPIADILPVKCLDIDDRMEHPEGIVPTVVKEHEAIRGLPKEWPYFLGYNKTLPIPEGDVLMEIDGDPFIAVRDYGKGRTAVFTSDCAPHWGSPAFVDWDYYATIWESLLNYICQ